VSRITGLLQEKRGRKKRAGFFGIAAPMEVRA
jgi:hypothetical protein